MKNDTNENSEFNEKYVDIDNDNVSEKDDNISIDWEYSDNET